MLTDVLKGLGAGEIRVATTAKAALTMAREESPQVIFTEYAGANWDGLELVRSIRRSDLACRKAPVIMITGEAFAHAILGARNAGVHEFLRKPYSTGDLTRRIEAVAGKGRDWVEGVGYVGPDRRRFNSGFAGPRKRKSDAEAAPTDADKLVQALRIVRSAMKAVDSDPHQALRALHAQAVDLSALSVSLRDKGLAVASAGLLKELSVADEAHVDRARLEGAAKPLLAFLPAAA
jgi:CheY-like chemotaxis protein